MVIFHLMNIDEKMRLAFLNSNDLLSKFEVTFQFPCALTTMLITQFLMIIEENYENVINVIKLDTDLNQEM